MRCSVVFGVTLRLLVINISSSSPAINTAAYYQRCVTLNLRDGGCGPSAPCWQHLACCSVINRQWSHIKAQKRDFCLLHLHLTVGVLPCRLVWKKLEWLEVKGKNIRRYVYSFWQNARTWRTHKHTHKQTDTAWQHRPRLHSIAQQKCFQLLLLLLTYFIAEIRTSLYKRLL